MKRLREASHYRSDHEPAQSSVWTTLIAVIAAESGFDMAGRLTPSVTPGQAGGAIGMAAGAGGA